MSSTDVFEQVRKGELTPREGAVLLAKNREALRAPTKPRWLPRPVYVVMLVVLAILLPGLFGKQS